MKDFLSYLISFVVYFVVCANTYSAPIMGGLSFDCEPESDTFVGVPMSREPVAMGNVDSVNEETFSLLTSEKSAWKENGFAYDAQSNPDFYYLKFTSGALEGSWFDISANTSYSISLKIGKNDLALVQKGDKFEIIPHWTLNKLFPEGGKLKKSTIPAKGVKCSIVAKYTYYDENGDLNIPVGANNSYQKFFYYRDFNGDVGWRERRSGNIDCGNQIIEPNAFILLRQPEDSEKITLKIVGQVPQYASAIEVSSLIDSNQENYTTLPSCSDIILNDLTESFVKSGLMKSSNGAVRPADSLLVYDNSATEQNRSASAIYFYYNGGLAEEGWYRVGSGAPSLRKAGNSIISTGSALIILKKSSETENFLRAKYKPSYVN